MQPDSQDDTFDVTFGLADVRVPRQTAIAFAVAATSIVVGGGLMLRSSISRCIYGVAIRGQVLLPDGTAVQGATVQLLSADNVQQTCQSSASGDYAFTGLRSGQNLTVRVALENHTFEPAEQNFAALNADATVNFTARPFPRISGTVRAASVCAAVQKVKLRLLEADGTLAHETETDNQGRYAFPAVAPGRSYRLQPSKASVRFAPAEARADDLAQDSVHDFAARISVSGQVKGEARGTRLRLVSASVDETSQVDAKGDFLFADLPAGEDYTLTPTRPFHAFNPADKRLGVLASDRKQNFNASRLRYWFTATVRADDGIADSIQVRVLKGKEEVVKWRDPPPSDSFSLDMLDAGFDYVLETQARYHDLVPDRVEVKALGGDTRLRLKATRKRIPVEVQVRDQDGQPVADAQLTLKPEDGEALTHNGADHTFAAPAGFEYRLSVQSATHAFDADSLDLDRLETEQHPRFTGVRLYSATGTVRTATGAAIPGAKLRISGGLVRELAGLNNGNFQERQLRHGGNYTLTPEARHYTFAPPSAALNALNAHSAGHAFVGTLNRHSIRGRVSDVANNPVPGWSVTLSEGANALAVAVPLVAAPGTYALNNLDAGHDYTLTPARANHDFDPPRRSYPDLGQDELAVDFRAIPHPTHANRVIALSHNRRVRLSDEAWHNYTGARGADHQIPVNELVVASEWAFARAADEPQGNNRAYYLPYPSGGWLTLVLIPTANANERVILTNYRTSAGQVRARLHLADLQFQALTEQRSGVLQHY